MPDERGLVLVVEDDAAIADLVSRYLRRDGYGVHLVTDGEAALAAVRRLRPVAVVLDVGLPKLDGIEVCRTMRAADDWTPVLFVTARDDEVDRVLGLELGADDYVTKPFSPRELVARVRSVLRRAAAAPAGDVLELGATRVDVGAASRVDGRRRGVADVDGVRPAGGADAAAGAGVRAGAAAVDGVGLRGGGRHPHRGRAHRAAARQARPGESDQDGPGRRLLPRTGRHEAAVVARGADHRAVPGGGRGDGAGGRRDRGAAGVHGVAGDHPADASDQADVVAAQLADVAAGRAGG